MLQFLTVESDKPEQRVTAAEQAADVLRAGGLVVLPTETVYGLAAWAGSDRGVAALREVKVAGQPRSFTVHLPDPDAARKYADLSSSLLRRLVSKLMPGPATLVVDVPEEQIPERVQALGLPPEARNRIYRDNVVSLRCPDHPLTQAILAGVDGPVVAASAAAPGQRLPVEAEQAAEALGDKADLVLDAGRCRYGKPSTVLRVQGLGSAAKVEIEREGVLDQRFIAKLLRWTLLLVCSGNTCRSPMAEALAKHLLAQRRGLAIADLEDHGLQVISAGVGALPGMSASSPAVMAMDQLGLDVSRHRSRALTPELIHQADVIYTMTDSHRRAVLEMVPSAVRKTFTLDPSGDIEDPIGSSTATYQRTAASIRGHLEQRLKEQQP